MIVGIVVGCGVGSAVGRSVPRATVTVGAFTLMTAEISVCTAAKKLAEAISVVTFEENADGPVPSADIDIVTSHT